ncbi:MAG: hypothetical protein GEV03_01680 [Streptosporangiales bacterium]|nr:hypothetical protein [Streptosporangiales bacterium]
MPTRAHRLLGIALALAAALVLSIALVRSEGATTPTGEETGTGDDEQVITTAYTTGYGWYDNTPPGSAVISHPVLHRRAGGAGTHDDPITVAVGHDRSTSRDALDYPPGTRIYVPNVRRYFVVEDTCGDGPRPQDGPCHDVSEAPSGATTWIDLWVEGRGADEETVRRCQEIVTSSGGALHTIVVNPRRDHAVTPGPILRDGRCIRPGDGGYGDTPVRGR